MTAKRVSLKSLTRSRFPSAPSKSELTFSLSLRQLAEASHLPAETSVKARVIFPKPSRCIQIFEVPLLSLLTLDGLSDLSPR